MKRIIPALICAAIVFVLPQTVRAHPGKTDSAGGHTNRSTGEYHYHHGYEAHDHYDMDGDGEEDCPYDFHDKTNHDSGSSDNSSSNNYIYDQPATRSTVPSIVMTTAPAGKAETLEEVNTMPNWSSTAIWVLIAIIVILALWCYVLKKKCEEAQNETYNIQSKYDLLKKWVTKGILSYQKRELDLQKHAINSNSDFGDNVRVNYRSISPIPMHADFKNTGNPLFLPDGVTVGDSGKLVSGYVCKSRPYGDYTVFVSISGSCYHSISYCSRTELTPTHIMTALNTKRPCSLCCGRDYPTSKPEWYINFVNASSSAEITWKE